MSAGYLIEFFDELLARCTDTDMTNFIIDYRTRFPLTLAASDNQLLVYSMDFKSAIIRRFPGLSQPGPFAEFDRIAAEFERSTPYFEQIIIFKLFFAPVSNLETSTLAFALSAILMHRTRITKDLFNEIYFDGICYPFLLELDQYRILMKLTAFLNSRPKITGFTLKGPSTAPKPPPPPRTVPPTSSPGSPPSSPLLGKAVPSESILKTSPRKSKSTAQSGKSKPITSEPTAQSGKSEPSKSEPTAQSGKSKPIKIPTRADFHKAQESLLDRPEIGEIEDNLKTPIRKPHRDPFTTPENLRSEVHKVTFENAVPRPPNLKPEWGLMLGRTLRYDSDSDHSSNHTMFDDVNPKSPDSKLPTTPPKLSSPEKLVPEQREKANPTEDIRLFKTATVKQQSLSLLHNKTQENIRLPMYNTFTKLTKKFSVMADKNPDLIKNLTFDKPGFVPPKLRIYLDPVTIQQLQLSLAEADNGVREILKGAKKETLALKIKNESSTGTIFKSVPPDDFIKDLKKNLPKKIEPGAELTHGIADIQLDLASREELGTFRKSDQLAKVLAFYKNAPKEERERLAPLLEPKLHTILKTTQRLHNILTGNDNNSFLDYPKIPRGMPKQGVVDTIIETHQVTPEQALSAIIQKVKPNAGTDTKLEVKYVHKAQPVPGQDSQTLIEILKTNQLRYLGDTENLDVPEKIQKLEFNADSIPGMSSALSGYSKYMLAAGHQIDYDHLDELTAEFPLNLAEVGYHDYNQLEALEQIAQTEFTCKTFDPDWNVNNPYVAAWDYYVHQPFLSDGAFHRKLINRLHHSGSTPENVHLLPSTVKKIAKETLLHLGFREGDQTTKDPFLYMVSRAIQTVFSDFPKQTFNGGLSELLKLSDLFRDYCRDLKFYVYFGNLEDMRDSHTYHLYMFMARALESVRRTRALTREFFTNYILALQLSNIVSSPEEDFSPIANIGNLRESCGLEIQIFYQTLEIRKSPDSSTMRCIGTTGKPFSTARQSAEFLREHFLWGSAEATKIPPDTSFIHLARPTFTHKENYELIEKIFERYKSGIQKFPIDLQEELNLSRIFQEFLEYNSDSRGGLLEMKDCPFSWQNQKACLLYHIQEYDSSVRRSAKTLDIFFQNSVLYRTFVPDLIPLFTNYETEYAKLTANKSLEEIVHQHVFDLNLPADRALSIFDPLVKSLKDFRDKVGIIFYQLANPWYVRDHYLKQLILHFPDRFDSTRGSSVLVNLLVNPPKDKEEGKVFTAHYNMLKLMGENSQKSGFHTNAPFIETEQAYLTYLQETYTTGRAQSEQLVKSPYSQGPVPFRVILQEYEQKRQEYLKFDSENPAVFVCSSIRVSDSPLPEFQRLYQLYKDMKISQNCFENSSYTITLQELKEDVTVDYQYFDIAKVVKLLEIYTELVKDVSSSSPPVIYADTKKLIQELFQRWSALAKFDVIACVSRSETRFDQKWPNFLAQLQSRRVGQDYIAAIFVRAKGDVSSFIRETTVGNLRLFGQFGFTEEIFRDFSDPQNLDGMFRVLGDKGSPISEKAVSHLTLLANALLNGMRALVDRAVKLMERFEIIDQFIEFIQVFYLRIIDTERRIPSWEEYIQLLEQLKQTFLTAS